MALVRSVASLCRQTYTCLFINPVLRQSIRCVSSKVESQGSTEVVKDNTENIIDKADEEFDKAVRSKMFPTEDHMKLVFDGIPFTELPIVHIKTTYNNTFVTLQNGDKTVTTSTGGKAGFRGRAKRSNMAAQAIATDISQKALFNDLKTVRVCISGTSASRWSALKALETSGLKIVSITDTTKIPFNGTRPRKAPRK